MASQSTSPSRLSPRAALPRTRALARASRPRQWVKNALVFSVPAASGTLGHWAILRETGFAFIAFCLVSSGTYLLNDAADVEADRLHPVKRLRPIAAGEVSIRTAQLTGVLSIVVGFAVALFGSLALLAVVAGYALLTYAYTRYLKHVPVFDIAAVAAGFFLRAVAGGVGPQIYISRWFLIVAGAGSLFLISGKRYAELQAGRGSAERTRPVLLHYSSDYLRGILSTAASVTAVAYCLWAFEGSAHKHPSGWTALSAVPFVIGIMRYGLLLEQGHGEEPEQVISSDRQLQAIGVVWLALLLVGFST